MAEEVNLTALSGEIVTGPRQGSLRPTRADEVEDAVFETVRQVRTSAVPMSSGMDLFGAVPGRIAARAPSAPAGIGFWCAGVALAVAAFWFAGGHTLASGWSGAAAEAPVRVAALTTQVLHRGGRPLLLVDGTLENVAADAAPLPALTVNVTDGEGRVTRYRLGRIDGRIDAHGTWRFSSRLEAPRSGVSTVTVTVGRETSG